MSLEKLYPDLAKILDGKSLIEIMEMASVIGIEQGGLCAVLYKIEEEISSIHRELAAIWEELDKSS